MIVLDSSVTLAWIYSDEYSKPISEVRALVSQSGAVVPSLWRLEVANVLEHGVRRGRHDATFRDETLTDLASLPIEVDPETDRPAWGPILLVAVSHRLTLYDAAYLELAKRRGLPLASLDAELRTAALAENLTLLGI